MFGTQLEHQFKKYPRLPCVRVGVFLWLSTAAHAATPPTGEEVPLPSPRPAQVTAAAPDDCPFPLETEVLPIDLPTALRLVNASNPTVNLARLRVDEAQAAVRLAQTAWLPNLQAGIGYIRHDGEIQNAMGVVFGTNKSNVSAIGGPVLDVDTSAGLFGPLIARQLARAQSAASQAVTNDLQMNVALAYLDLMQSYGQLAVNTDVLARDQEMLRRAEEAQRAQLSKTGADINRARTEYQLRIHERIGLKGQVRIASARLARLLVLKPTVGLKPAEPMVVPVVLVPEDGCLDDLVARAIVYRPEVVEGQALVDVSRTRLRQSRLSPMLPHLQVGYTAGGFGGGINSDISHFEPRGDGSAQAVWQLNGLGYGYKAQNRVRSIQVEEASTHVTEVQAQVAEEVTEAAQLARVRKEALLSSQEAIRQALEMFRKLDAISFGTTGPKKEFDSLEPLLAIQALAQSRFQYLNDVIEYNRAQFQLYRSMGQPPIEALPQSGVLPTEVPTIPTPYVP